MLNGTSRLWGLILFFSKSAIKSVDASLLSIDIVFHFCHKSLHTYIAASLANSEGLSEASVFPVTLFRFRVGKALRILLYQVVGLNQYGHQALYRAWGAPHSYSCYCSPNRGHSGTSSYISRRSNSHTVSRSCKGF